MFTDFRLLVVIVGVSSTILFTRGSEITQPCPRALSIPLTGAEKFENGSYLYNKHLFSPEFTWSDGQVVFGCPCQVFESCVRTCCAPGKLMNGSVCVDPKDFIAKPVRPNDENLEEELRWIKSLDDHFFTIPNIICPTSEKYQLDPENFPEDIFVLYANGTLTTELQMFNQASYCIGNSIVNQTMIVAICFDPDQILPSSSEMIYYPFGMIISIPFFVATAIIYAILPEIRNLHGKTLMCYVLGLAVAYSTMAVAQLDYYGKIPLTGCIAMAFIIYFSFLASFFWLNVMCFDIWWTFGGFRSMQGSVKQRESKKFIAYSIYAWGSATTLTIICLIMDLVPGIPESVYRPQFGVEKCWFCTEEAKAVYFYLPMGITVLCNIILFISTAAKIIQHKKDTAHHLKGSDSRRHDDNKQWFNLYLKLFIVMGINWSMEIISWLFKGPSHLWYLTDLGNALQGVIIFIIFVWKDKIKRLLIKRFGCQGPNFLSGGSTRSAHMHSSASRTCTTSVPLHEKINSSPDPISRGKSTSDDSDGV